MAHNVTSTGFRVSWSSSPAQNRTFHIQVSRGGVPLSSSWTRAQTVAVAGLEAGVLYEVKTSYQGCGANISAVLTVKTGELPNGLRVILALFWGPSMAAPQCPRAH